MHERGSSSGIISRSNHDWRIAANRVRAPLVPQAEDEKIAPNPRKLLPNCKVENEGEIGNCRWSIRRRRVIRRSTRSGKPCFARALLISSVISVVALTKGKTGCSYTWYTFVRVSSRGTKANKFFMLSEIDDINW
jgi:hypothetical protein